MKGFLFFRSAFKITALILAAALLMGDFPLAGAQPAAAACGAVDKFGYALTCDTVANIGWVDISSSGTLLPFDMADDVLSSAIPLGFTFPFYEKSYTVVYASTNGALFFNQITDTETLDSDRIPRSRAPQSLLAPFWADLYVGGTNGNINKGEVYYKMSGTTPNRYMVIQYKNVTRLEEGTAPLNFEVILRENGMIDFLYDSLTGDLNTASVGIEDSDGVVGIQHVYKEPGLSNGLALRFTRPAGEYRVKAFSEADSGLVVAGRGEVSLTFRNSGDKGNDIIQFPAVGLPAGWSYLLLNAATRTDLGDSDGNGIKDSGSLAPGADVKVLVRVFGPANAAPSETIEFTLVAQSKGKPTQTAQTALRFSVPPAFAYAYSKVTSLNGMTYGATSNRRRAEFSLVVNYTGSSLGITQLTNKRMFYIWEKAGTNSKSIPTTYLTGMILDEFGGVRRNAWVPTANDYNNSDVFTNDTRPAMAQNPALNNYIGLFYRHDQGDIDNMYLTVLDTNGNVIPAFGAQRDITHQATSKPYDYQSPVIAVSAAGRFVLAWTATFSDTLTRTTDIWTASYDANTLAEVKAPAKVTASVHGANFYDSPVLTPLDDGRVLLAYTVYETAGTPVNYVEWVALDSAGNKAAGAPFNYKGSLPSNNPDTTFQKDAMQLYSGGPILLAWVNTGTETVHAVLLTNALNGNYSQPVNMSTPNHRAPGNLSVTSTREGYGVLLWEDVSSSQYIYYSLISGIGEILAQPTTLVKTEQVGIQTLTASLSAQGLAPIEGFNQINLPTVFDTFSRALMSADEEEIWQP